MATHDAPKYTAAEARRRLEEGNARFVAGEAHFPTVQKAVLAELARGQQPYATILGCSDSRVPPELLFDAGFGELFVIRVAGNVLGPSISGTLQYAAVHLRTPLFVVLGHDGCGAVDAALASTLHGAKHKERIEILLQNILPALESLDTTLPPSALLGAAVEANVRWTIASILDAPEAKARLVQGEMQLVGAIYDLDTGRVRFLE